VITVDARPQPLELDPDRSAVLVIDMQNDFGAPGGMFDRAGIDISGIAAAAEATRPVLDAARATGVPVVYLNMEHAPDLSDLGPADAPHALKHALFGVGDGHTLIRGTWNTQNVDGLAPRPGDIVVSKHRYSGFFETELDDVLRGLDVKYLIVTGCTTSVCVESTVRDAMFRDYTCVVLEDCSAEPIGPENHAASLRVIELLIGWVSTADAVCAALAPQAELV
jgi:ureidoacrylate peracid hydrolase